ncbi:MAG: hypothetical protein RR319_09090, partial [Bacteroides sp.]
RNTPAAAVLGMKAIDYLQLSKKPNLDTAYQWLSESVEKMQTESEHYVLQYFMDISSQKFKIDPNHREKFIQDYLTAASLAEKALSTATKEKDKKNYKLVKDNLDAYFINSGAADCKMLQSIYGDKVETNKTNLEYLKNVISVMRMLKCTDQEAYFAASLYAHKIAPTSETAAGCAYMALKKKDTEEAIKFFDQAIQLEQENIKKAEFAYNAAAILASVKNLSRARQYARRAIELNGNYGAPYILIAQLYATSPNWSDESTLNRCTYFLVIDKLQRAKSVDPSVTSEANRLIGSYAGHTPKTEDLFFLNMKKGDSVTIGGWIGESTVIR